MKTIILYLKGLERGSVVKSTCYFYRGPGFGSQHTRGDSQLPLTPVPGHPVLSSDFHKDHACTWYIHTHTYTHRGNTLRHINKILKVNKIK